MDAVTQLRTASCLVALLCSMAAAARAGPRPLPFTFPYETYALGQRSAEVMLDLIPTAHALGTGRPERMALAALRRAGSIVNKNPRAC